MGEDPAVKGGSLCHPGAHERRLRDRILVCPSGLTQLHLPRNEVTGLGAPEQTAPRSPSSDAKVAFTFIDSFAGIGGSQIRLPNRSTPNTQFLTYHNENIFRG